MTRMWGINPEDMCDKHLLGEHKEMHQIAGTIENHPHGKAIALGHVKKGQLDTSLINDRHYELAVEMLNRGMEHDSPIDYHDKLGIGEINIFKNRRDLMDRCDDCAKKIIFNADEVAEEW